MIKNEKFQNQLSSAALIYRSVFYIGAMFVLTLIVPICLYCSLGLTSMGAYVASIAALTFINQGQFFVAMRQLVALIKYLPLFAPSGLFLVAIYFLLGDVPSFLKYCTELNGIIVNLAMFFFGFFNFAAKAYAEDLTENGYFWGSFIVD